MSVEEFAIKNKVKLPKEHWNKIKILDEMSGLYCYHTPIEHSVYTGYFYVPGFEDHVVSREMVVLDLRRKKIRTWSVWRDPKNVKKGGYRVTSVPDNTGRKRRFTRHRAMASAFITYELREPKMLVNHKNGIPGDDRIDNLEWVTYSENNKHAYDSSLYRDGKTVAVIYRNRDTGETRQFSSVAECSDTLNIRYNLVRDRALNNKVLFDDGLDFKLDDGKPWGDRRIVRAPKIREICSRDVNAKIITIFKDVREASQATGVSVASIDLQCSAATVTPIEGLNFRYFEPGMMFPDHSAKSLYYFNNAGKGAKGLLYTLVDSEKTEVKSFVSIADMAEFLGIKEYICIKMAQGRYSHPLYTVETHNPRECSNLIHAPLGSNV